MTTWLFVLLVCYLPIVEKFLPGTDFGSGIPDLGPVRICSYLLIVALMVDFALGRRIKVFYKWILILMSYSIIVFASVSWSNYSYNSTTLPYLFDRVITPMIIAIIALNLFQNTTARNLYLKNILIASSVLALISIVQLILGGTMVLGEIRSAATFSNPNSLAIFLVLCIPCIIYASEKRMIPETIGWLIIALVAGGIVCTVSRKGMATAVLAVFIFYFLKKRFKKIMVFTICLLPLAIGIAGYQVVSDRFSSEVMEKNITGRTEMVLAGLDMFAKHPFFGLGYKGYYENFSKYFPYSNQEKYDAHNMYVTALTDQGMLGFIPFLVVFLYPLYVSSGIVRSDDKKLLNPELKDMAVICISSIIPFMLSGLFAGGLFYQHVVLFVLYANISMVLCCTKKSNDIDQPCVKQ